MKFLSSLCFILIFVSACSVYQSEGRKFLEKQAYEYAGVAAQPNFKGCQSTPSVDGMKVVHSEPRALVYSSSEKPLDIRVVPLDGRTYGCDYGFTSADELNSKLTPAIDLTLRQSAP